MCIYIYIYTHRDTGVSEKIRDLGISDAGLLVQLKRELLFVYAYLSIYLSIYLSLSLSIYLSIYLSIFLCN